jgi:hypothetical protein
MIQKELLKLVQMRKNYIERDFELLLIRIKCNEFGKLVSKDRKILAYLLSYCVCVCMIKLWLNFV